MHTVSQAPACDTESFVIEVKRFLRTFLTHPQHFMQIPSTCPEPLLLWTPIGQSSTHMPHLVHFFFVKLRLYFKYIYMISFLDPEACNNLCNGSIPSTSTGPLFLSFSLICSRLQPFPFIIPRSFSATSSENS